MTEREIFALQKKYPDSEVMNKGRILRRNLDEIVFIASVNHQLNEITKKMVTIIFFIGSIYLRV